MSIFKKFQKVVISGRVLRRQISKIDVFEEFWLFLKNVNFCQFLSIFVGFWQKRHFSKSGHFRPGFEEANFKNRRFWKSSIFQKIDFLTTVFYKNLNTTSWSNPNDKLCTQFTQFDNTLVFHVFYTIFYAKSTIRKSHSGVKMTRLWHRITFLRQLISSTPFCDKNRSVVSVTTVFRLSLTRLSGLIFKNEQKCT